MNKPHTPTFLALVAKPNLPEGAFAHEWLDRLVPRWGLASQLLLGRPHKADTFCLTAALPRPQHGRTSTTKCLQTLSTASVSLPRCFPHCRVLAPLEGQAPSHTLWGQGAPWRPPGSSFRLPRTQARLKSIRRGCCLSLQTRYSFILGWYSGSFLQSLPKWKCSGTLKS